MPELQDRVQSALASRYAIQREVGRGGMATVYLAQDLRHGRPVALKILHPHLAASIGPDRFKREVEIAARLSHPHILTLMDSGEVGDLLYYVMPFIRGESLRGRLEREGQLPISDALAITRHVAVALGYAHEKGIIHRDIKPENILLYEGEPMITDFGIAKAVSAATTEHLTQTGTVIGTPAYMSPEQAGGDADLDGRADQYSLACTLYEMLAGQPPFTGPSPQAIMMKQFAEAPPSIRKARPQVAEALDRALTKALAKAPAERFASMLEFAKALPSTAATPTPELPPTVVSSPLASTAKSIAVLPFVNMSADPENEYFSDGIAEEIINALTKIQALRVASRTSAFAFKGKGEDIKEIGRKLQVATVLEGSVRKAGNKLRVTAQLVSATDGYHLWSERYDRQLEDVFAIQDEIAENIVRALRVMLSDAEKRAIEKPATTDIEAYDYYLRGRQFFHQFRRTAMQFARRMFERAMEIDPGYALAHAGAADCCSFLYMYWDASKANLEGADAYSRKAMELRPELAEAHAARGLAVSLSKRYAEAEREFDTAIRLNPKLFEAHYFFGRASFQQGKHADAVRHYEDASRVRPEDYQTSMLMSFAYGGLGSKAEALAALRKGLQVAERHLELNPDDARALYLSANALVQLGERQKGLEWADRARALDPDDSGVLYNVACIHALAGDADGALGLLDKAIQNGFGHREWLENDPDFAALRTDPRFEALLKKL